MNENSTTDSNVVKFFPKEAAKDPDMVLEQALGQYTDVLILGWNKDGTFDPRGTLSLSKEMAVFLCEVFKTNLLMGVYDIED